jgi:hypothetical protein
VFDVILSDALFALPGIEAGPEVNVILSAAKDLSEPRDASRLLRRNNRVSGSLPY